MMHIWDKLKSVPANRLRTIQAGRLKGKSDINPQWRYQVLTEVFGPCGIGWKYTIDKQWLESGDNGQMAAFANVSLYIRHNGEWSDAIPANGGSMFIENESRGPHTSDEAFKMAITDALGTAAKMLGVAADVYLGNNDTKYNTAPEPAPNQVAKAPDAELPWLSEGQFAKALERVKNGEDLLPSLSTSFRIKRAFREQLEAAKTK
jgi:hypothetical protein